MLVMILVTFWTVKMALLTELSLLTWMCYNLDVPDIPNNHATCAGVAPIDGLVLDTVGYMNDRTKVSDIKSH